MVLRVAVWLSFCLVVPALVLWVVGSSEPLLCFRGLAVWSCLCQFDMVVCPTLCFGFVALGLCVGLCVGFGWFWYGCYVATHVWLLRHVCCYALVGWLLWWLCVSCPFVFCRVACLVWFSAHVGFVLAIQTVVAVWSVI